MSVSRASATVMPEEAVAEATAGEPLVPSAAEATAGEPLAPPAAVTVGAVATIICSSG